MTEAEEQGSNPSDATTALDVPSQGDEGPGTAQAAPTAAVPNASSILLALDHTDTKQAIEC